MSGFIQGADRNQGYLLPERIDEYVSEDNAVRVIEAFVEELDFGKLGFARVAANATGRPAYHPATLLKIYLYGYLNRIQSSRRLEQEANRNLELMWLTGRLAPDFKTLPCAASLSCYAGDWVCSRRPLWRSTAASSKRSTIGTATSRVGR
jgi:transposase